MATEQGVLSPCHFQHASVVPNTECCFNVVCAYLKLTTLVSLHLGPIQEQSADIRIALVATVLPKTGRNKDITEA